MKYFSPGMKNPILEYHQEVEFFIYIYSELTFWHVTIIIIIKSQVPVAWVKR